MENLIIAGQITATSNKQGEFKQEVSTKTVYITVDDENKKKATAFGLTVYSSKEDKTDFIIVKAPAKGITQWVNGENKGKLDGTTETPNFKTVDGLPIGINIIKGENKGNEFFRITDVQLGALSDIEPIEQENPFA